MFGAFVALFWSRCPLFNGADTCAGCHAALARYVTEALTRKEP